MRTGKALVADSSRSRSSRSAPTSAQGVCAPVASRRSVTSIRPFVPGGWFNSAESSTPSNFPNSDLAPAAVNRSPAVDRAGSRRSAWKARSSAGGRVKVVRSSVRPMRSRFCFHRSDPVLGSDLRRSSEALVTEPAARKVPPWQFPSNFSSSHSSCDAKRIRASTASALKTNGTAPAPTTTGMASLPPLIVTAVIAGTWNPSRSDHRSLSWSWSAKTCSPADPRARLRFTCSTTMPRPSRSLMRLNSSSAPRSRNWSSSGPFTRSGRPIWFTCRNAYRNTPIASTVPRPHQRKVRR